MMIPPFIQRRLSHRPNLMKIVDNMGWMVSEKMLRLGVGLFVSAWMARYLGPEEFGLLNFALAFVGLFGAMATLGLQDIVVRDLVLEPAGARLTLGSAAMLQMVGGLISFLLILGIVNHLRPDDPIARSIVAILGSMMLVKFGDIVVYWFESQVLTKYIVWVRNVAFLVFAAGKIALIVLNASLSAFTWMMLAEAATITIAMLFVLGMYGIPLGELRATGARAVQLLKDSWPLLFSGMVLMVQARIDQIMLGQMVGDLEVGYYSAALGIIESAAVLSMLLRSSFGPTIIAAKKHSQALFLKRLESFYKLNVVSALAIGVPIALFSDVIVRGLYGGTYGPASILMSIMCIRLLFSHIGVSRGLFLLNENLLKYAAITMAVGTVVNIALNYVMIPLYKGVGATVASLVSFFVTIFVIDCFKKEARMHLVILIRSLKPPFTRGRI